MEYKIIKHSDDYLMHYGVIGMKWGVRRYQNYDGSYTQRGLERFRKEYSKYESKKREYDSIKKSGATKPQIKKVRREKREAYSKANKAYKHLKLDKKADKGKRLYMNGKTMGDNLLRNKWGQIGIIAATAMAGHVANQQKAVLMTKKYGNIPVSAIIEVAGTGASIGLVAKTVSDNKKLRAYYSHSNYKG